MENKYCDNCPASLGEQFDIICPKETTCGANNVNDPTCTTCMNFTCCPVSLVVCILSTPFCACNICVDKCRKIKDNRSNTQIVLQDIVVEQPNIVTEVVNS